MTLSRNTSVSLALSFATSVTTAPAPNLSAKTSSLRPSDSTRNKNASSKVKSASQMDRPRDFSLYRGVSDRPLGWKARRKIVPDIGQAARDANIKRWDGVSRTTSDWDGLRRDPELWYPDGDCLVHLYGQGQSKRGPAFKVPFEALLNARCRPLLNKFLVQDHDAAPVSEPSSSDDAEYFNWTAKSGNYELYIPAPPTGDRRKAMLHHIATRNFFAWICRRPMVGPHLGGALVELMNSMKVFRSHDADNVGDILDYMEEEDYADMRSDSNHALAILFFAEYFQFKTLWIDAYAHCAGMSERLFESSEYEHISQVSRILIRHGRQEMDSRLNNCGASLGTFLEDELSSARLGVSAGARAHLDYFRSFLQGYYVEKLGYYPPIAADTSSSAFPGDIYAYMAAEFQQLYEFLADEQFTSSDCSHIPAQGGICVLQNVQAFDQRHQHEPLRHPLCLLPEPACISSRSLTSRVSRIGKADKLHSSFDKRLVILSSLAKASKRRDAELMKCSLVKAYSLFEKDYIFSSVKADKNSDLSLADARKIRWILVYTMLQTLRSATEVPIEVRDTQDMPYSLCVRTAGCPPWREEQGSISRLDQEIGQTEQYWDDSSAFGSPNTMSSPYMDSAETFTAIKPDIDYFQLSRNLSQTSLSSSRPSTPKVLRKNSLRRALSTKSNIPELRHPRPVRNSFHEILVHGYGSGHHPVVISNPTSPAPGMSKRYANNSTDSIILDSPTDTNFSLSWSQTDSDISPPASIGDGGRRKSDASISRGIAMDCFERPVAVLVRKASSIYDAGDDDEGSQSLEPEPLDLSKKAYLQYDTIEGTPFGGHMFC